MLCQPLKCVYTYVLMKGIVDKLRPFHMHAHSVAVNKALISLLLGDVLVLVCVCECCVHRNIFSAYYRITE